MNKPSFKPCCPNHGEPLEGLPFPIPEKGTGICPISGCRFAYEVEIDEEEKVVDKFGKESKRMKWKLDGKES
jgi:hypothetical protein